MTMPTKLDARGKLAAAEATVKRWVTALAKAEGDVTKAADRGDAERMCAVLERVDRLRDRLTTALAKAERLKADLPKAIRREQSAVRAARMGMKLADRICSQAQTARRAGALSKAETRKGRKTQEPENLNIERGYKVVPDPWMPGARISVPCNRRESPIEHMVARKRLDGSQEAAANRYRALYEAAQLGPLRAIDPSRERVCGGGADDPLSDHVMQAARELARVHRGLGRVASALVINIIGEGLSIDAMARRYPHMTEKRANGYVTGRIIEALDQLVEMWGMIGEGYDLSAA